MFVAVLLAPVLPDATVELLDADSPSWRDPALRAAAVMLVLARV